MWRIAFLFKKGMRYFSKHGFLNTIEKVFISTKQWGRLYNHSKEWMVEEEILKKQRESIFESAPTISIIVPLYNTPEPFLSEMLDSVCAQSYVNWQLCLADGSDCINFIEQIVQKYVINYPNKIKYTRLNENRGISENTNACIALSDGEYLALLDHDDVLAPNALFEAAKAITEQVADFIYTDEAVFSKNLSHIIAVHFKPDFAIDNLRGNNYVCHFTLFKKKLLEEVGMFRKEYNGSQDHDIILRLTEVAENIVHIPKVLYFWRAHKNSVASDVTSKSYAIEAGKKAVSDHLIRQGIKAKVESSTVFPTIYRIKYELLEKPLISIIISNKDYVKELKGCVESIFRMSIYQNYEIIIVDNDSVDKEVFFYYEEILSRKNIQVLFRNYPFNYSTAYNLGMQHAKGKYLLFLHNDTKVIAPNWMEEMLMYAQRPDVGAVGAKLYYPNGTIQQAGILLRFGRKQIIEYVYNKYSRYDPGYMGRLHYSQDISAVTAACMMVRKSLFEEVGGMNERFAVSCNDIDFCLRLRKAGYLVVFTPYSELYHYDLDLCNVGDINVNVEQNLKEIELFKEYWEKEYVAENLHYR